MLSGKDKTLKYFGLEGYAFSFQVICTNDFFGFSKIQHVKLIVS